ncbi:MAG: hypothetical protein GYA12_10625 [Chloroflexi bacterium]|nr:hypothetical protein [Chloroflexota bacterium]
MPDPIQNKLGAYMDGELNRQERLEVERHIETCAACREEIQELTRVSNLLHDARLPEFTPANDFKTRLMLQLPRQQVVNRQNGREKFLWVGPVVALVAFIFLEVTTNLSSILAWAGQFGLMTLGGGNPSQMIWFSALKMLPGDLIAVPGLTWLNLVNNAGVLTQQVLVTLAWQTAAAILYWGLFVLAWKKTAGRQWAGMMEK